MNKLIILLLFLSLSKEEKSKHTSESEQTTIQVKIENGIVQGEILRGRKDFKINAFRGIPYAKAPIESLQFKKPEPLDNWEGVKETKTWPKRCIQSIRYGIVAEYLPSDSSDCLYLNVFAPNKPDRNQTNAFPVMIWIHGGGFSMGSTVEYGIKGITQRIVQKGVLLIAMHYRLGIWGFFSTGDKVSYGNYGLWDITLALQWVKNNIAFFGGDPKKITLFGQSSGSAAVRALSISPHSYNLFHQTIAMSGTIDDPWSTLDDQVVEASVKVAQTINCSKTTSLSTMECIRNKSTSQQLEAVKQFYADNPKLAYLPFVPREDGDFFPEPISLLKKKAPAKPMIIGSTEMEGGFDAAPPIPEWNALYEIFDQKYFEAVIEGTFSENTAKDKIVSTLVKQHYIGKDNKKQTHQEKKLSEKTRESKKDKPKKLFRQYIQFLSDYQIFVTTYKEACANSRKSPTWLYSFGHYNPDAFPTNHSFRGAQHGMELPYIFGRGYFADYKFNKEDNAIAKLVTILWTNFAKYGNPTPEPYKGLIWEEFNEANDVYLSIKSKSRMKTNYELNAIYFWTKFIPKILEQLNQREKNRKKSTSHQEL